MTVAGIIAECNPFHEGHSHLIREARRITGADYVICALSGDYVQRGAPAVFGWERRVPALLKGGADLVLGLPLYVSCSGADYFARGGIALLEATGAVTDLCFGSESGDLSRLEEAARLLSETAGKESSFDEGLSSYDVKLREGLSCGLPFPAARERALSSGESPFPRTSNDILGVEYLKALKLSGSRIRPHAVPMIDCPSASDRRAALLSRRGESGADSCLCRDDLSQALLHALTAYMDDPELLSSHLDVSVDLARRILRLLPRYESFTSFASLLKNRSLTYTRISRALLHILLGMTGRSMETLEMSALCGWIRPLGFRRSASPLLSEIRSRCTVPYLSGPADAKKLLSPELYGLFLQELRAELFYDLTSRTPAAKHPMQKPPIYL